MDGEIRDNAAQIPRSIVTVPTPQVSHGAGIHPLLALRMVLSRSRPRDALEGLVQGIKAAGLGLLFCLVLSVSTLASAIMGVRKRGIFFALKCIVGGSIGTALAAVGALAAGVAQMMRGLANTPTAIRARAEDQVWDAPVRDGCWDVHSAPFQDSTSPLYAAPADLICCMRCGMR